MGAQNSITNADERKLVMRQIRRAKARIRSYTELAEELGVDIGPSRRYEVNTRDTHGLSQAVGGWEGLVIAYDTVELMLRNGIKSLSEVSTFVANLMVTRGYAQIDQVVFDRARQGSLELNKTQHLLDKYGFELTSLTVRQLSADEQEAQKIKPARASILKSDKDKPWNM